MASSSQSRSPTLLSLSKLHLDVGNPRFGARLGGPKTERQLVNEIAQNHGIKDVLSSLAANGFFESEPLVGATNKGNGKDVTIVEGNRRLAACLILIDDERAQDQAQRRLQYPNSKFGPSDRIPVILYDWKVKEDREKLLPYLGIRHIVGAQPWDSYAKAAWVAQVLKDGALTLDEIVAMIGDENRTVVRFLDGYFFANQVQEAGQFSPNQSMRPGRGSNPDFPFSWVYSALDYSNLRKFVGMPELGSTPKANPISKSKLDNAGDLMRFMFGDAARGANPVVSDSRELRDLARAIESDEALRLMRKGQKVHEALSSIRPAVEQAKDLLFDAADKAEEAFKLVALQSISTKEAAELQPTVGRLSNAASKIRKRLTEIENQTSEEDAGDVSKH
ncbi:MAG: hypothetical protein ABSB33_03020 [Tepidisphaeraceae bacterium]|jgi:hypothetical protein